MKDQMESISLEYKPSFRTPYPDYPPAEVDDNGQQFFQLGKYKLSSKKKIQQYLEIQSLKAIVAFLNTRGGKLIIGVTDEKELAGIECEEFENNDKYVLHRTNCIKKRIGKKFINNFINIRIIEIQNKKVCLIECEKYLPKTGETPAFLDGTILYTRQGPSSNSIEGEELARFTVERPNAV